MAKEIYRKDFDKRIIDGVSVALDGEIGRADDVERLMSVITSEDKVKTACEIAVAFIRFAQDLKANINEIKEGLEEIKKEQEQKIYQYCERCGHRYFDKPKVLPKDASNSHTNCEFCYEELNQEWGMHN
jgi:hypothetical protein